MATKYCSHIITEHWGQRRQRQCGNLVSAGNDLCWRHSPEYKSPLERCQVENAKLREKTEFLIAENSTLRDENRLLKQLCDEIDPAARKRRRGDKE